MPDDPTDELGVWCRECGSTTFVTIRTDRCVEGDIRLHRCRACGKEFGSIATLLDRAATHRKKYTPLAAK